MKRKHFYLGLILGSFFISALSFAKDTHKRPKLVTPDSAIEGREPASNKSVIVRGVNEYGVKQIIDTKNNVVCFTYGLVGSPAISCTAVDRAIE